MRTCQSVAYPCTFLPQLFFCPLILQHNRSILPTPTCCTPCHQGAIVRLAARLYRTAILQPCPHPAASVQPQPGATLHILFLASGCLGISAPPCLAQAFNTPGTAASGMYCSFTTSSSYALPRAVQSLCLLGSTLWVNTVSSCRAVCLHPSAPCSLKSRSSHPFSFSCVLCFTDCGCLPCPAPSLAALAGCMATGNLATQNHATSNTVLRSMG